MKDQGIRREKEIWILQHPSSRYGVIQVMSEEICRALGMLPYSLKPCLFERNTERYMNAIQGWAESDSMALCRLVVNQTIPDDIIFELYGVPHVSYLLDAVIHFPDLLQRSPYLRSIVAFVDGDSRDAFKKITAKNAHWVPHAIDAERIEKTNFEKGLYNIAYKDRPIDIVVSGSWIDSKREEAFWRESLSIKTREKLYEIAHQVLFLENEKNHLPLLYELLRDDEGARNELLKAFSHDIYSAYGSLERYIRGKDRERFIELLNGFHGKIAILSHTNDVPEWKKRLPEGLDADFHTDVPYEETWSFYANSKVVVNSVPTIKKGLHERLLAALFCSAKVITTPSTLLPSGKLLEEAVFDIRKMRSANDIEAIVHSSYKSPEEVVEWVKCHHTWVERLKQAWPAIEGEIRAIVKERQEATI